MVTLVSDILRDAYRESNLIAIGTEPSGAQVIEGMRFINRLIPSVLGYEAGEQLSPLYSDKYDSEYSDLRNVRFVYSSIVPMSLKLCDSYEDGVRLSVTDPFNRLLSNPLTLSSATARINGQDSFVVTEPVEVFYRADLGDWRVVTPLSETDLWPFPTEFDDMFIIMLAFRLNPRYNIQSAGESMSMLKRSTSQFRSRYTQTKTVLPDIPLNWLDSDFNYSGSFNTGKAYRW